MIIFDYVLCIIEFSFISIVSIEIFVDVFPFHLILKTPPWFFGI